MQKFFKNLREKIRLNLFPEPQEVQSLYKGRVILFTVDKVEGNIILYAIDFGRTIYVKGIEASEEMSSWLDNISLDKFSVEVMSLGALRITQRKGGN